jgi:3-oxoacyl-[acyl-carrier protein] reductase
MQMNFRDRTAIVTGAARGIGRAICIELARNGCNIAFNYSRSKADAQQLEKELSSLGIGYYSHMASVGDFGSAEAMIHEVLEKFGKVDYLVNNAGIVRDKLLFRMNERDWDEVIETNLKGAFNYAKAVLPSMAKARFGSILNITSVSGTTGMPGQVNYSASKAGLIGLTKALAKELSSRNITVNALALGLIDTDMTSGLSGDFKAEALKMIPAKRFGTVEEVAAVAAFLLSDAARYITGQVIQMDGGLAI